MNGLWILALTLIWTNNAKGLDFQSTVVCSSSSSAVLTLDTTETVEDYESCKISLKGSTSTYNLDSTCLSPNMFYILPKHNSPGFTTEKKLISIECKANNDGHIETISKHIHVDNAPDQVQVTFSPGLAQEVIKMSIQTTEPTDKVHLTESTATTKVTIGQSFYVVIFGDSTKTDPLIPIDCKASHGPPEDDPPHTITLWDIAGCSKHDNIFEEIKNLPQGDPTVVVAKLKAFEIIDHAGNDITITCTVHHCSLADISAQTANTCKRDSEAFKTMIQGTCPTPAPLNPSRRRRRADNSHVHTVSAKLIILEDVGLSGGSRLWITIPLVLFYTGLGFLF